MTTIEIRVTFTTALGHKVVESFPCAPQGNGFVPASAYKLRAMSLGWTIDKIEEIKS